MSFIFIIVAIILFALAAFPKVSGQVPVHLGWLGLAFWAASTVVGG